MAAPLGGAIRPSKFDHSWAVALPWGFDPRELRVPLAWISCRSEFPRTPEASSRRKTE